MTNPAPDLNNVNIAVIGLGYVGLPLAVELGRRYPTVGFDVDVRRIEELQAGRDHTLEVDAAGLADACQLTFSREIDALKSANFYIVTVPTPIDQYKRPDMSALRAASRTIGSVLSPGDVVVYESTVYPGPTEEVCTPVTEEVSGLIYNRDFFAGYSP